MKTYFCWYFLSYIVHKLLKQTDKIKVLSMSQINRFSLCRLDSVPLNKLFCHIIVDNFRINSVGEAQVVPLAINPVVKCFHLET